MPRSPSNWIEWGIAAAVFLLVMSAILPDALDDWFNVSTSDWPSSVESIWDLVVILLLVALAMIGWRAVKDNT